MRRAAGLGLLMVVLAGPALGETDAPLFASDAHRYGRSPLLLGLAKRTVLDLVAIPAGVVRWDGADAATFELVLATTVALSMPPSPSVDARIQWWLHESLGASRFTLWTPAGDFAIWATLWTAVGGTFFYGLIADEPEPVEVSALAVEAFLVAQVYCNLLKLATGREGPKDGDGTGPYHGPAAFARLWPSGTPSGHITTAYAIFAVAMTYWDAPWLTALLHAAGIALAVTLITDDYHFASDVVLGAALGYCIGRWVVEHRSTRFENGSDGLPRRIASRLTFAPVVVPGGGAGAALGFAW